ncbi:hypothetical protein [Chryseobacterium sp. CH1]|uniref:hypothetical protein n=1 Tax=Chryseobacterium sp. CH1 TaxID=713551 RepID=UPI0013E99CA6|nr:hypothetical protein [Chryseobacterium sp. CH1]
MAIGILIISIPIALRQASDLDGIKTTDKRSISMIKRFRADPKMSKRNPPIAKSSSLVIKYPNRHIFPSKKQSPKTDFPILIIS